MPRGVAITDTRTTRPMTGSVSEQVENSSKLISSSQKSCWPPRFIFESVSICVVNARCNRDRVRAAESRSRGRLAAVLGLLGGGFGFGLLERDGGAPFRGMDSAQGAELAFLRFAQRRLVRPPLARVIAPSEKRQHGKRNRDERDHCRNCRENIEKLAVQRDKYVTLSSGQHRVPCAALSTCASCSFANLLMLAPLISTATKQLPRRDELATFHSITSSASATSVGGISRPSAL